jgi:hypothetical protein
LWRKQICRWLELDWAQRFTLFEAAWTLIAAQAAVKLLPFGRIAPGLGQLGEPPPITPLAADAAQQAQRVGWAVRALAHYLPWDARCLAQAIAASWMLRRRGLPGTFYLGVDHGQATWLEAHAWLRCGDAILTGEPQHERFKVIAVFTEEGR